MDAEIAYVFCNRQPGESEGSDEFFKLVNSYRVPVIHLSSRLYRKAVHGKRSRRGVPLPSWRDDFDDEVERAIERGAKLPLPGLRVAGQDGSDLILTQALATKKGTQDQDTALATVGEPAQRTFSDAPELSGFKVIEALSDSERKPIDFVLLAGYMLIVTRNLHDKYKMLNLHPALPEGPTGTWQQVIWQLIDQRAHISGAMIHIATQMLDQGPLVARCIFPLRGPGFDPLWQALGSRTAAEIQSDEGEDHPLFREIRRHGAIREQPLVLETLRALALGRVRVEDRRVLDASSRELAGGLDLTTEIDAALGNPI
ncbi:MAG: formyltransferase family protein [Dehalococcoidia bacterium]